MAPGTSMEQHLNKRKALKAKLTRAENDAEAISASPVDRISIKIELELLDTLRQEIQTLEENILVSCPEEQFDEHQQQLTGMLNRYKAVKLKLLQLITPAEPTAQVLPQPQPAPGPAPQQGSHHAHQPQVKLPKLELPRFSGGLLEWMSFRDRFKAAVHDKPMAGSLKLEYLKGQLDGKAAAFLQGVPNSDDDYEGSWKALVERFENKRELGRAHLDRFLQQATAPNNNADSLRNLVDTTRECLRTLKVLGLPTEHWDFFVCHMLASKLNAETKRQWERTFEDDSFPDLNKFLKFLDTEARSYAACSSDNKASTTKSTAAEKGSRTSAHHATTTTAAPCKFSCANPHPLFRCPKFNGLSVKDRREWVKSNKHCFNCLKPGHSADKCENGTCKTCGAKHHTMLHLNDSAAVAATTLHASDGSTVLLATAVALVRDAHGHFQEVRCLLDSGSKSTFIREDCVQRLGLTKQKVRVTFCGVGETPVCTAKGAVDVVLRSRTDPKFQHTATAMVLPTVTSPQPAFQLPSEDWSHLKQLCLADPNFHLPARVDLILGGDVYDDLITQGVLKGDVGVPTARCTVFGWVLSGPVRSTQPCLTAQVFHACCELEQTMKKFWSFETVPERKVLSVEEKACEDHFLRTYSRDSSGRFVVRLPFKLNHAPLGDSRKTALRRLFQCEKKLAAQPEKKSKYNAVLQEYLDLNHMEKVPFEDLNKPSSDVFYLPHHAVIKESSTTTKLRVVFDASAKTSSGVSLNNVLMVGPTIQEDLFSILVRARKHQILFTADVEKMYRMVLCHPEDQDFQRILWRRSEHEPIQEYRLKTVTFGVASAPYQAIRALRKLAEDSAAIYPLAAETILSDFYVDDVISGHDTLEMALELQRQLLELLACGGFHLRKWSSNCEALLENLSPELRETQLPLTIDSTAMIKTLGIKWHPATDEFKFTVNLPTTENLTKRSMASLLATVFDPLGWLSPVTVRGKILLQSLWFTKLDWDDPVDEKMKRSWEAYLGDLNSLSQVTLSRCICISGATNYQLHCFSDASEAAVAAVVFLRTSDANGDAMVKMVAAKTSIAPKKKKTLPRLELEGALLLSQLVASIQRALKLPIDEVHAYTDSTIVLQWVTSAPEKWKTYVANRVAAIQEIISPRAWHHVPGAQNPADCASRGVTAEDLLHHPLWWTGPSWIHDGAIPDSPVALVPAENDDPPTIFAGHAAADDKDNDLLMRYSSFSKLIRITSYCSRFAFNCRTRDEANRATGWLTSAELRQAEITWAKVVQGTHLSHLLTTLKEPPGGRSLPDAFAQLNPFVDVDGVIRVGGRLQNSRLLQDAKHPIVLPKRCYLTELIVRYEHDRNLHGGSQIVLSAIQQRYWVLGARELVRRIIRRCIRCHRYKADAAQQLMAPLPLPRSTPAHPFIRVGVDFAGPLTLRDMKVKKTRTTYKGYVALFICLSTKAIHLELVDALTTQACIDAMIRFISRRGKPDLILSDQGRNVVGAKKRLSQLEKLLQSQRHNDSVMKTLAEHHIEWKLNPPYAPHFGGIWEAGVKSMKHHLHRVLGNNVLNYAEMYTLLTQVEACLNSRPLTALSRDPNDLAPLTPGHFLIGRPLTALPNRDYDFDKLSHLSRWHLLQKLLLHFWRRWSREFLTRLQNRPKWWRQNANLKEGDLVLIKEHNLPPQEWRLGRVTATHPGNDGLVRTVTLIVTDDGKNKYEIKRAISKVSPLPYND